jgi:hypothetical protein
MANPDQKKDLKEEVVQEEAGKKFFVFGRPNNFNKKTPAG